MGTSEHLDTTVDVEKPGAEVPGPVRPAGTTERPQGSPCWVKGGSSWSAGIGPAHDRIGLIGCDARAPSIDTTEAAVRLNMRTATAATAGTAERLQKMGEESNASKVETLLDCFGYSA
jgi:hypothetical protein